MKCIFGLTERNCDAIDFVIGLHSEVKTEEEHGKANPFEELKEYLSDILLHTSTITMEMSICICISVFCSICPYRIKKRIVFHSDEEDDEIPFGFA